MSVQGPGPGPRYGHVMALVGTRYLMAIGGNDGKYSNSSPFALCGLVVFVSENLKGPRKRPLADTAAKPYQWCKLESKGKGPPPCMCAFASMNSTLFDSYFVVTYLSA